jgi:hypothetical protein
LGGAGTRGEPRAETQRTARDIGAKASAAEQHASLCVLAADTSSRRQSLRVVPRAVGSSPPSRHGAPPAVPCAAHRQGAWRLRVSLAPTAHAMPSALSNPKPRRTPGRALCVFVRGVRRRFCPPRLFICFLGRLVCFLAASSPLRRSCGASTGVGMRSSPQRFQPPAEVRAAHCSDPWGFLDPRALAVPQRWTFIHDGCEAEIRFLLTYTNEICGITLAALRLMCACSRIRQRRGGRGAVARARPLRMPSRAWRVQHATAPPPVPPPAQRVPPIR